MGWVVMEFNGNGSHFVSSEKKNKQTNKSPNPLGCWASFIICGTKEQRQKTKEKTRHRERDKDEEEEEMMMMKSQKSKSAIIHLVFR